MHSTTTLKTKNHPTTLNPILLTSPRETKPKNHLSAPSRILSLCSPILHDQRQNSNISQLTTDPLTCSYSAVSTCPAQTPNARQTNRPTPPNTNLQPTHPWRKNSRHNAQLPSQILQLSPRSANNAPITHGDATTNPTLTLLASFQTKPRAKKR
ncbi:hypothetical protein P171DRAFT_428250 [Karstenula rhodostoma CBS 690.94]|uniref:Uncharacterized protein n=1 Tax=Karstenula rhodostoma CBS 690.94 TaxID=1392251 RepID=A0A9P4PQ41_9PLEO|nr:hypothetical protein P171DRAFT_428250 [Karstenula rhodostoma CBS 690.94]